MSEPARPPVAERIRAARTRLGVEPGVLADRLGLTFESYRDLEWFDDEAFTAISLAQVLCLAEMLHMTAAELLAADDAEGSNPPVSMASLIRILRARLAREGGGVESFGERIGWDIANALADPASAWREWNVDCLIDVATAVDVDWIAVLSGTPSERVS